jgi:exonuclease V gamma subunit
MLHIHFSNRLELLRTALLQRLDADPPADVFTAEQVIVPSAALRRHLSLAVADARGICANLHFDFLAQWLWQQTAFAMTVHKAQGSEFDEVLVLLPAQRSRVLTRELLYTALTRARQRVLLAAGAGVLASAVDSRTRRQSGLLARLHDAAAGAA